MREYEKVDELLSLLKPFDIKVVYADNNFAYQSRVRSSEGVTGKENT
ncbi:MAG: IS1 family transposase [Treponema sp.]|nr:IS1 family transposase [Treponema sp.]